MPAEGLRTHARLQSEELTKTTGSSVVHGVGDFLDGVVGIEEEQLDFANGNGVDDVGRGLACDLFADVCEVLGRDSHLVGVPAHRAARRVVGFEQLDKTIEELVDARFIVYDFGDSGRVGVVDALTHTLFHHVENLEDYRLCQGIGYAVLVGADLSDVEVDELLVGVVQGYLVLVHVDDVVMPDVLQLVVPVVFRAQTRIDDIVDGFLLHAKDKALEIRRVHITARQEIGHTEHNVVLVHLVALSVRLDAQTPLFAHDYHHRPHRQGYIPHQAVQIVGDTDVFERDDFFHTLYVNYYV